MTARNEIREKIAIATKMLLAERMIGPFGHCSARVPDTDLFAILGHKDNHVKDASEISSEICLQNHSFFWVISGHPEAYRGTH